MSALPIYYWEAREGWGCGGWGRDGMEHVPKEAGIPKEPDYESVLAISVFHGEPP